jgi:hypothetical protein
VCEILLKIERLFRFGKAPSAMSICSLPLLTASYCENEMTGG